MRVGGAEEGHKRDKYFNLVFEKVESSSWVAGKYTIFQGEGVNL